MSNAPRKTAAKKTTGKRTTPARSSDSPSAPAFNFDTWDRGDDIEPFPIVIGGKRYVSEDPVGLDFREVVAGMQDPERMMRALFPDNHEEILENNIPVGALSHFSEAIATHFGLQDFTAAQS